MGKTRSHAKEITTSPTVGQTCRLSVGKKKEVKFPYKPTSYDPSDCFYPSTRRLRIPEHSCVAGTDGSTSFGLLLHFAAACGSQAGRGCGVGQPKTKSVRHGNNVSGPPRIGTARGRRLGGKKYWRGNRKSTRKSVCLCWGQPWG